MTERSYSVIILCFIHIVTEESYCSICLCAWFDFCGDLYTWLLGQLHCVSLDCSMNFVILVWILLCAGVYYYLWISWKVWGTPVCINDCWKLFIECPMKYWTLSHLFECCCVLVYIIMWNSWEVWGTPVCIDVCRKLFYVESSIRYLIVSHYCCVLVCIIICDICVSVCKEIFFFF